MGRPLAHIPKIFAAPLAPLDLASSTQRQEVLDVIPSKVAAQIRQLRLSHGLTQEQFAEKIGVSHATISLWETDKRGRISLAQLLQIAGLFDIAFAPAFTEWKNFIVWFRSSVRPINSYEQEKVNQDAAV